MHHMSVPHTMHFAAFEHGRRMLPLGLPVFLQHADPGGAYSILGPAPVRSGHDLTIPPHSGRVGIQPTCP